MFSFLNLILVVGLFLRRLTLRILLHEGNLIHFQIYKVTKPPQPHSPSANTHTEPDNVYFGVFAMVIYLGKRYVLMPHLNFKRPMHMKHSEHVFIVTEFYSCVLVSGGIL
jgi:hypothetical protein